jgi:hypothetical protein
MREEIMKAAFEPISQKIEPKKIDRTQKSFKNEIENLSEFYKPLS